MPWVSKLISHQSWRLLSFTPAERGKASSISSLDLDLAVIDRYGDVGHEVRRLKSQDVTVAQIVDSYAIPCLSADLVLNPETPFDLLCAAGEEPVYLNGPRYALIRHEIRDLAIWRSRLGLESLRGPTGASRPVIVVMAGGTDASGFLSLPHWTNVGRILGAKVVLGPASPTRHSKDSLDDSGVTLRLCQGEELMREAAAADFVISASGVTSWELMHIGVPTGLVAITENQRPNYDYLTSREWAVGLGRSPADLLGISALEHIVEIEQRISGGLWQEQRIDGLGAERAVLQLLKLI